MPCSSAEAGRDLSDCGLFLDFDGTLVEIAPTPDTVVVEPALIALIIRLRERLGGALAIVTGRALADVDRLLPGLRLDACGMHGLERRVAGVAVMPDGLLDLSPEIARLRERLSGHPGLIVEDKRIGVAVHWRTAPESEKAARAAIDDLFGRLGPAYKIQDGKAVREIVPAGAGKGEGIRALMRLPPYEGRLPIFFGDDKTDEHGFDAVNALNGLSVKVGAGETAATFRVGSVTAVREMLRSWAEEGRVEPQSLKRS